MENPELGWLLDREEPAAKVDGESCPGYQLPLILRLGVGGFWSLLLRKQNTLLPDALMAFGQMLGLCCISLDSVWVASKLTYPNPKDNKKKCGTWCEETCVLASTC